MTICKYCKHRLRSLSVWDSFHWKYERMGIIYTHTKHDYNSIKCAVKGCNCKSPIIFLDNMPKIKK